MTNHRLHQPTATVNRGFTLIEILVVVAIIALLIAILLPSLKKARDQSKNVLCMANLQQIGLACTMYAANTPKTVFPDWAAVGGSGFRVFPGFRDPLANQIETRGLPAALAKTRNVKLDTKLWRCPLNDRDQKYGNTYFWNINDASTQNPQSYKPLRRMNMINDASGLWYVGDNYNLRPYAPGARMPTSKTALNTGYFIENRFYHTGKSKQTIFSNTTGSTASRLYGQGFNTYRMDGTVGFAVLGQ